METLDFVPKLRLCVYQNQNGFYLETEEAVVKSGKVSFKAAVPFRSDHLKTLAEFIIEKEQEKEDLMIYPEDMLMRKKDFVVIFDRPIHRKLKFSKSLKVKNGTFQIPGLIYLFKGYSLDVFAYKGVHRPDKDTELFKAPFYNVYDSGNICMGNNKMNKLNELGNPYNAASAARHLFFSSVFTHYSDTNKLKDMTLEKFYRENPDNFPYDNLISHGKTLQEEIRSQVR